MTYLYIFFILVLLLVIFEVAQRYLRNQKETFANKSREGFENPNSKTYFEENTLIQFGDNITGSAVNIRHPYRAQVGVFGTSGETPAYLQCPSCNLQFDCANYPYEVDERYGAVCNNCIEKKLYNEFNIPVYAKSVGSPRKCRDLLSNKVN